MAIRQPHLLTASFSRWLSRWLSRCCSSTNDVIGVSGLINAIQVGILGNACSQVPRSWGFQVLRLITSGLEPLSNAFLHLAHLEDKVFITFTSYLISRQFFLTHRLLNCQVKEPSWQSLTPGYVFYLISQIASINWLKFIDVLEIETIAYIIVVNVPLRL